jgi:hypothetical protein
METGSAVVERWARPVYEAYIAGCWLIHLTDDTLYWVSKPRLHYEAGRDPRRLHRVDGPAVESDVEPLYFLTGVLVPEGVVMRPEAITAGEIDEEPNVEVRRVMTERMGYERYILESGAALVQSDECGALYRRDFDDDEPLMVVHVINSTPEPDGERKKYMLRVHPELRPMLPGGGLGEPQEMTARNAVASTFGLRGVEYAPGVET